MKALVDVRIMGLGRINPNGESMMSHLRRNYSPPSRATVKRWRLVLGAAVLAAALIHVKDASADPKAEPGPGRGPHAAGKPPGGRPTPSELFGRPSPDGKHNGKPDRKHDGSDARHLHGQGAAFEALKEKEGNGSLSSAEKEELDRLRHLPRPRMTAEQRKARLSELQKMESDGKASDAEKSELERMKQGQARREAIEKRYAEMVRDRRSRSREAKRQALKEFPKLGKDGNALAEYRKHADRLAKLERSKELAAADDRSDMVQKIDGLIAKEKQRHQAWLAKQTPAAAVSAQGDKP